MTAAKPKVETVPLDQLTPDAGNARVHGRNNLAAIRASLDASAVSRPLLTTSSGTVLAGDGTLAAMRALGWTEAQVLRLPGTTRTQCRAYAIADNRTAELAAWDADTLADQVGDLSAAGSRWTPSASAGQRGRRTRAGGRPTPSPQGGAAGRYLPLPGLRLPLAPRWRGGGAAVSATLKIERSRPPTSRRTPPTPGFRAPRRNLDAIKASLEAFGRQGRSSSPRPAWCWPATARSPPHSSCSRWNTIDVTRYPFAGEAEARAFALADNRAGELAQWNAPVLMEALRGLALEGWKLEELGFAPETSPPGSAAGARGAEEFPAYDEDVETAYLCPRCAPEWSGRPE